MEDPKPRKTVKMLLEDPEEINFSDDDADIPIITKHVNRNIFDGISIKSSQR
jgi:hypothetical protein